MKKFAGIDGTEAFIEAHGDDRNVLKVLNGLTVGELHDEAGILSMQEQVTRNVLCLILASFSGRSKIIYTS